MNDNNIHILKGEYIDTLGSQVILDNNNNNNILFHHISEKKIHFRSCSLRALSCNNICLKDLILNSNKTNHVLSRKLDKKYVINNGVDAGGMMIE